MTHQAYNTALAVCGIVWLISCAGIMTRHMIRRQGTPRKGTMFMFWSKKKKPAADRELVVDTVGLILDTADAGCTLFMRARGWRFVPPELGKRYKVSYTVYEGSDTRILESWEAV